MVPSNLNLRSLTLALAFLCIGASDGTDVSRAQLRAIVRDAATSGRPGNSPLPRGVAPGVEKWLKTNAESIESVGAGPLKEMPWGYSTYRPARDGPARLYLHVFDWHASGKVIAYGLAGGVKRAYLLNDSKRGDLPIAATGRDTLMTAAKEAPDPLDTVVVLELDGEPKLVPLAVSPREDGSIVLDASAAIVHGKTLRYEPEPHKNTVGYWTDPKDWASWQFEVKGPGDYDVDILQGCGKGSGGSTVDFSAAGKTLTVTVQDTGGFQNFVTRRIGRFHFDKPGEYTLTVKPAHKPGVAVMDLRQVTMTRAGE